MAFLVTLTSTYLIVSSVSRSASEAAVTLDSSLMPPAASPEVTPAEAAKQSGSSVVQYCSNNVYRFDGRPRKKKCRAPNPWGDLGCGTCNLGGPGGLLDWGNGLELDNTGFDDTNAVQQFGDAEGLPGDLISQTGSAIDNASFNYVHLASDYEDPTAKNPFSSPRLTRFFRSREASTIGSFGVSGFCTYDIKLKLFTTNTYGSGGYGSGGYGGYGGYGGGSSSAFIVPDANTSDSQRPYVFDPNSPAGRAHRGKLAFFDTNNNPVTPTNGTVPRTVRYVEFTAEDRTLYRFETLRTATNGAFDTDRSTDARLVRMQDKNGYGTTVTYPTLTAGQVQTSYDLQWQINQVTGDDGRTLTFTYHAVQYGGRWCVSQIAFPNGANATYAYSGTRLTTVTGSDGTVSTFTYGGLYRNYGTGVVNQNPANGTLQADTVTIVDPAAAAGHQRKTVVLTLANLNVDPNQPFFTQASQLVRSVINDANEVTYQNYPFANQSSNSWTNVYEGKGTMKRVINHASTGIGVQYYDDGWQILDGTLTGNVETSPQTYSARSPAPGSITEASGEVKTYTYLPYDYMSGWWVSQVAYSDGSTETFQYDAEYRVTRQKDRLGNVTKHTYDTRGNRLTTQVGLVDNGAGGENATPETATTTYEYYPTGHAHQYLLKSLTDPLGNKTDYEYNTNHRLSKIISPPDTTGGARAETEYLYDTAGRVSTIITPGGWSVAYTYDARNRVTKITHADNSTERYFYGTGTEANLLVKAKDRAGVVTMYEYDLAGRRIKTIQSYATMDLADNETLITDPALKVEEVCTYIPGTELKASCFRAGEKTTYVYDYRHRLVETKTQPRVGKILTSKKVFKDNKQFSTEDPYGRKTFYAYRASDARLVRTIQATVPSVSYADFAAVLAATRAAPTSPNPTSLITDYTLDNSGRTVATIDPLGITHTVAYDSRGRTTEQIAASGTSVAAKTKTIYDLASRTVEVQYPRYFDSTDTNGFNKSRTTMTYTGRGLLASRTESPGTAEVATETYTYNIEGRQLTRVDARGFTWTTVWNTCCGRQQGSFDPYGHGTIVNVDNLGQVTHTASVSNVISHAANYKDPIDTQTLGETTTKYDSRGRVTARTVWLTPLGQIDPNNVPIYTGAPVNDSANPPAAPYGLTTTYAYDDNLTDNTGLDATFSTHLTGLSLGVDSDGSAVLTTNPAGERTLAIRDGLGRGVRSVQLDGSNAALTSNTSTFDIVVTISGYGDVLETTSANALGHTNKSRTDGVGRTIQTLDATSAITAFTYDAGGRRLSGRDPNNVGQDCTYDALGRDLSCTDTAGAVTSRTFNLAGNVKAQVDAKSHTTTMVYDSRGRRVGMTDRINATTTWAFDAAGNELTMTDAENQTTAYTYDSSGRRISIQWPDHVAGQNPGDANYGIEATAYDEAGRVLRKTNQLGDTVTSVYDLGSRMTARQYRTKTNSPSGTTSSVDAFTYDAGSRMLTGVNGLYSNTVALAYDQAGRKASESLMIAEQTYTVGTAYDGAGRVQMLTYPDGTTVERTYDSRNLLSTIAYGGGTIDFRTYDAGGRLSTEILGNGQVVTRSYLTGDNLPASINNSAVGNYIYGWDANKNKTSETITGAMSGYGFSVPTNGYDDQNRLTAWNRTDGTKNQSWALSAVGDWNTFTDAGTAVNRNHGPTHEILTIGSATVTHDSRGNMTQDEQVKQFAWDANGMLASAVVPSGAATGVAGTHTYQYDVLGRRVRKTTGGAGASDTIYVRDSQIVVAEYSVSVNPTLPLRKYINASYVDEPVLIVDRTAAGSVGAGTDERFYYHRNQQYSITALCDNAGTPIERYAYAAYGEPTIIDGAGMTTRTTSFIANTYLYTAQEHDPESGLQHFNSRMYEVRKGRFVGRDRVSLNIGNLSLNETWLHADSYRDGNNLYTSFSSSPCTLIDPDGMECTCPGGNWTHRGSSWSVGLCYQYARYTGVAYCSKARRNQLVTYDCNGTPVQKYNICYCKADVTITNHSGGIQAGGGWAAFEGGVIKGAPNCKALGSSGWGTNWQIGIAIVGVEGGGSEEGGSYGGAGLGIGAEVGVGYGKSYTSASECASSCQEESFTPQEKAVSKAAAKAGSPCKIKSVLLLNPAQEIENPYKP
jgi:RHS repeat-associated protein